MTFKKGLKDKSEEKSRLQKNQERKEPPEQRKRATVSYLKRANK